MMIDVRVDLLYRARGFALSGTTGVMTRQDVSDDLGETQDRGERRPQLVAHVGEEGALHAASAAASLHRASLPALGSVMSARVR
jgi:hypothetical protein